VITEATFNRIFSNCGEDAWDVVVLYLFYVRKKLDEKKRFGGTSSVFAVNSYCMKGLGWGNRRMNKAKKHLKSLGLIAADKRDGGNFVRVAHAAGANQHVLESIGALQHHKYTEQDNLNTQNKNINTRTGNYFLSPDELDS